MGMEMGMGIGTGMGMGIGTWMGTMGAPLWLPPPWHYGTQRGTVAPTGDSGAYEGTTFSSGDDGTQWGSTMPNRDELSGYRVGMKVKLSRSMSHQRDCPHWGGRTDVPRIPPYIPTVQPFSVLKVSQNDRFTSFSPKIEGWHVVHPHYLSGPRLSDTKGTLCPPPPPHHCLAQPHRDSDAAVWGGRRGGCNHFGGDLQ